MIARAALSIIMLALAGCATPQTDSASGNIAKDSEFCRSQVAASLVGRGEITGAPAQDRYQSFDNAYRSCMQSKGYDVKS